MSSVSTLYRRLTYLLVASTFILIMLGGYVKAIHAGLACPDWPLCYGKLFPFADGGTYDYANYMIFAEWFHRLWASLVGILLLVVVFQASHYQSTVPLLLRLGLLCMVLFALQVILGGLTVGTKLEPFIVVFHLANAVLIIMIEMSMAFVATFNSEIMKKHSVPSST